MKVKLTRKYQFSSAHRLNSTDLSEAENREIYDKCNNLHGHGHDYTIYITIEGKPHPDTGMILQIKEFDDIVWKTLQLLDYKHLDKEVEFFKTEISTAENIIQFIWSNLHEKFGNIKLAYLKLWETNNNYFELGRELN
jgi:6-pyruvoyltetrahydropterin/6-carboxytetrahydropterin synthase